MKKIHKITACLTALATVLGAALMINVTKNHSASADDGALAFSESARISETAFAPTASSSGALIETVSKYDFTNNGIDFVYNYDWASYTYALGYGDHKQGDNDLFRINTCGGGLEPRLLGYTANGDDVSGAEWVCMFVDTRGLDNSDGVRFGFNLYFSASAKLAQSNSAASAPLNLVDGRSGFFYSTETCEWRSAVISDGKITLGDGFVGYVAFPLSAYAHANEDGRKYISGVTTSAQLFAAGYKYLCRTWMFFDVADTFESQSPIFVDDISFYKHGAAHAHSYQKTDTVLPGCESEGYDIYTCPTCKGLAKRNITKAAGHSFGEYKKDGDGIAYRLCSVCPSVEADGNITSAADGTDELCTVTFDFGDAGGEVKLKFRRGDTITYEDIPRKNYYKKEFIYQFNCWCEDEGNICPLDPEGIKVEEDMTFYARYMISNYADKYKGAVSVIAQNGGTYYWEEGKVVVLGNSNMSLYHGLESSFASSGLPAYNNSVAGSTSYEMIEYYKALVLTYKPKVIVANVTTNDMAYYSMSERQIFSNMKELYEMTRELLPDAYLLFVSGNPLPGRTEYYPMTVRVNAAVKKFAEEQEMCGFVNTYDKVLAYGEKYPTSWDTWTHLNQAGLEDMFSGIKTAIKDWCRENNVTFN